MKVITYHLNIVEVTLLKNVQDKLKMGEVS